MNQSIHPAVLIAIIVIAVIGLSIWGYKAMQPAPYMPSPGTGGRPAVMPGGPPGSMTGTGSSTPVYPGSALPPQKK